MSVKITTHPQAAQALAAVATAALTVLHAPLASAATLLGTIVAGQRNATAEETQTIATAFAQAATTTATAVSEAQTALTTAQANATAVNAVVSAVAAVPTA